MATFFYRDIIDKNFLDRYLPQFLGIDGDKAYFDVLLYVIGFRYHLTPTSWKNPEIFRLQSRKKMGVTSRPRY